MILKCLIMIDWRYLLICRTLCVPLTSSFVSVGSHSSDSILKFFLFLKLLFEEFSSVVKHVCKIHVDVSDKSNLNLQIERYLSPIQLKCLQAASQFVPMLGIV